MTGPGPASFLFSTSRLLLAVTLTIGASALLTAPAYSAVALSADSLDVPAQRIDERLPAPLLSVARAGDAMIGVGLHGLVGDGIYWRGMVGYHGAGIGAVVGQVSLGYRFGKGGH